MRTISILIVLVLAVPALAESKPKPTPVTGEPQPKLAELDKLMLDFLAEQKFPGATLAIAREGRLVYARGFGYADPDHKTPMQPTALFRIASISKAITI